MKLLANFKPTLKKILIAVACLVLIVAFIPFSGTSMLGSSSSSSPIKVGKYNINPNIIKAELINYLRVYQMQGQQPSQRDIYNMLNYSVQNNVVKYLYVNESNKLGIKIDNSILNEAIINNPYFKNEEGKFDKELFKQIISSQFKNEQEFKKSLETDISLTMFTSAVDIKIDYPQEVLQYAYQGINQTRYIEYITINKESIKDIPEITQEYINKTYTENKSSFTVPEYRDIDLIYFNTSSFKNIKATDSEIKEFYKENIASYKEEDLYDISQALFTSKEEAEKAYKKLKEGSETIKDNDIFVDIGSLNKQVVNNVYSYDINKQSIGSFSTPIKTDVGYHILFLKGITKGKTIPLSEVKNSISSTLSLQKQQIAIDNFKVNIQSKAKEVKSLKELANNNQLSYINYKGINKQGLRKKDNTPIDNNGKAMLDTAFTLSNNATSNFKQEGSSFYLVKVINIENSYVKSIEDVKPEIEKTWNSSQKQIKALEIANNINAENASSKNLVSPKYSTKKSSVSLTNNTINNKIFTYSNVQSIFNLANYENTIISNPSSNYITVVKLVEIKSGKYNKQQYNAFKDNMQEFLDQQSGISYLGYLYNEYEIKIDQEKLSQIIFKQ